MPARWAAAAALLLAVTAGCEPSECDEICDRLAEQCDATTDDSVCYDDCDEAEGPCQRCFSCLESEGACEREPNGPCWDECDGCRP